jgi:hypothetical protein
MSLVRARHREPRRGVAIQEVKDCVRRLRIAASGPEGVDRQSV